MVAATSRRHADQPAASTALEALAAIVPALAEAIGPNCEVVLHDLSQMPHSIVALGGNLTSRSIGGPMTDFGLEQMRQGGTDEHLLGYSAQTREGHTLRSSTMFLRDAEGEVIGCLCVNLDLSVLLEVRELADRLIGSTRQQAALTDAAEARETFPVSVEELTVTAVREAIASVGLPVELMRKDQKREIVRLLEERGLFLIRDAVEYVAKALSLSRYSVYNYLNELNAQSDDAVTVAGRKRRRATMRALPGVEPETPPRLPSPQRRMETP